MRVNSIHVVRIRRGVPPASQSWALNWGRASGGGFGGMRRRGDKVTALVGQDSFVVLKGRGMERGGEVAKVSVRVLEIAVEFAIEGDIVSDDKGGDVGVLRFGEGGGTLLWWSGGDGDGIIWCPGWKRGD